MPSQVLVVYESHTGNTRRMAEAVAEGVGDVKGVLVALKSVTEVEAEDLAHADGIIVGAPTRNAQVPAATKQLLERMKQVPLQGKPGAVFGSYGWSGEAPGLIRSSLVAQGLRVPGVGVRAKRTPDAEALEQCRQLGATVAQRIREAAG